jgi:PAS domain S-box-containing protein
MSEGSSAAEGAAIPEKGNDSREVVPIQGILEGSPAGAYRTDTAGRCVWVNAMWCELTGLSLEDALGDGWRRAIHPDDMERLMVEWSRLPKERAIFCSEYRFRRPDGSVRWVLGRASEQFDDSGKFIGFIGVCVDISELRQRSARPEKQALEAGTKLPSERELEVAALLADGFSNKLIAKRLGISIRTVEAHRARLMRKLRLKSLAGLVRYAIERGLVKP